MYTPGVVYGRSTTSTFATRDPAGERWYYRYPEEQRAADPIAVGGPRRRLYEPSAYADPQPSPYVERKGYDMRTAQSARAPLAPGLNFERPNWGRRPGPEAPQGRSYGKSVEDDDLDSQTDDDRGGIVVRENQRADVDGPAPSPKLAPSPRRGAEDHRLDQVQRLRDQMALLAQERDDLQLRLDEMAVARQGRVESRGETEWLQEQLRAARSEINTLKAELRRAPAATSEMEELQGELADVRAELQEARSALTELRIQQDNWKHEKAKMERDFDAELHEAEREVRQLQDARDQLQAQRDQLEDALQQAQVDFDELSTQFNLLTVKSAELEGVPAPPPRTPARQYSPSQPPAGPAYAPAHAHAPRPPQPDFVSPKAERDLKTGPVRGRGAFAPQDRAGDRPWAVRTRSTSPGPLTGGREPHTELCHRMGLGLRVLDNAYDPEDGILDVQTVGQGSLAEKAGIRLGDRIEKWNNRAILNREAFYEAVRKTPAGSSLRLGLNRAGIRKQVIITVP